jgi:multicomponent Na+:H+ antiporter subunit E
MIRFAFTFLIAFVMWIMFSLTLQPLELIIGLVMALAVAGVSHKLMFHKKAGRFLHPIRWGAALFYLAALFYAEVRSHLEVSRMILTGKIRPAFVEVPVNLQRDSSRALLGNTITITPGTLTVRTGNRFLIHWLNYDKKGSPGKSFERIGRMITE